MFKNRLMPTSRSAADLLDQAVAAVRQITDPEMRFREAGNLDAALATARSDLAQIRRDAVNQMRAPQTAYGYGSIAGRLGLTKGRVQQIANTPLRTYPSAYAFRDEHGTWHGTLDLLPEGRYAEAPTLIPFNPAYRYNPLGGQTLLVRYGDIGDKQPVSTYTLPVSQDGQQVNLRMTSAVQDALFGPPIMGTPERSRWEAACEQRKRELDGP
jgi:hypothetical protein